MHLVDQPNSTFTTLELARLATYRAAIEAGFFTDWDGSAASPDTTVLAWLPRNGDASDGEGGGYPFTTEERQHLEALRARIGEGAYADDGPPPPPPAAGSATDEEAAR